MKKLLALALAALMLCAALVSCGSSDADKTITVAASSAPHAEILEQCVAAMAEKGYTLTVRVMDDYIVPNTATEDGEVDANYFQHVPYLESFNAENGTHLVSVAQIHYEPYAIYAGTAKTLDELTDGAKVAVPNDPTNEARALQLLAAEGLLTLKEGAGLTATKLDIVENPKNLEIMEMEAALLPTVLDDVAVAVINGNYAIANGLKVADSLGQESAESEAAQTFANVLVVKEGNEKNEGILALVDALKTEAVKNFIAEKYEGAVVPLF
ncbi:MAG: MetQ/NlpA family ABC transporter substrate-binding protein [Clostridia bacterium]|nr:MetQ/NlpA family ABC transporter substrate-binding protein [Clostridia bacterium]